MEMFKEMQDTELKVQNQLRDENRNLKAENDSLRDEIMELKKK